MSNIESILRQINRDLVPQFEAQLREHLAEKDREWLIEQIVRLTLDAHSLHEMDRRVLQEAKNTHRLERIARLKEMHLDQQKLAVFISQYGSYDRQRLIDDGLLQPSIPNKGGDLLLEKDRTAAGQALLQYAKDVLFGLLFGDETTGTQFHHKEQELLTLTVPRGKVEAIDFMKATTELSAYGTWQDPAGAANDQRADNVLLEVEYGEVEGELIGHGIILALSLINNLEINEQVLYARMINVEQTTLIT